MAFALMREWRLRVLRITVELDGTGSQVHAELVGFPEGQPNAIWESRYQPVEFGLVGRTRGTTVERLVVPSALVDGVAGAVAPANTSGVWLHLREPRGRLGAVPWEEALVPALGAPLLRLPNRLPVDTDIADVYRLALVVSLVDPERAVAEVLPLVAGVRETVARPLRVDLFADRGVLDHLAHHLQGMPDDLQVHDPVTAGATAAHRRARTAAVQTVQPVSPRGVEPSRGAALWASWVAEATRRVGVDTLGLVGDGLLDGERGLIAVADVPAHACAPTTLAYLEADDVRRLGDAVGAETLVVRSPAGNPFELATRLVADVVGVNRAGTTVHSSGRADPESRGVAELHAWLAVGALRYGVPRVPGQFLYVQPARAVVSGAPDGTEELVGARSWKQPPPLARSDPAPTGAGVPTRGAMPARAGARPAWARSAQQFVDAEARNLILEEKGGTPRSISKLAYDDGRRAALSEAQVFLDRHVEGRS